MTYDEILEELYAIKRKGYDEITPNDDPSVDIASIYLGSYMALDPCGKYHHSLSLNGCKKKCLQFWDDLEKAANELDGWITGGEGDPTDIFFQWGIPHEEEEEEEDEIKSSREKPKKPQFPYPNYFKTGNRLKFFLDHPDLWESGQESLDRNFAYLFFELEGEGREQDALNGQMFERPDWLDLDGIVYQLDSSLKWLKDLITDENVFCQYVEGYYEPYSLGEFHSYHELDYIYIGSQKLDEEVEHQAEDGSCHYEYRGPSHLRIWLKLSDETSAYLKHYAEHWGEER